MPNQSAPLDRLFHALADPTRRGMVERLSCGPASVGEPARLLAMSLSAVMPRLQVLEASGLVRSEAVGEGRAGAHLPHRAGAPRTVEAWIAERRTTWERRLERLGAYLAEHPDQPEQGSGA
jgi:DNA-binding transcriptional ArsR family regulator